MIKFCRNCGMELAAADDKLCKSCGANAVKATTYCRYCGRPTSVEDITCLHCGASIKPLPGSVRSLFEHPRLSARMGKVVNLSIVSVMVASYVVFSLPKSVTKPIQAKTADVVFTSTGYTALPLTALSTFPTKIPMVNDAPGNALYFRVKDTQQLTAYAIYKSTDVTANNATKASRVEEVTVNCTFVSNNPSVATVTPEGLVTAVALGTTNVVISYTAVPGSANMSSGARTEGRKPITVTFTVTVKVT